MKKGFTVIELIVSFVLVSIISIILFELIFSIKELYVSGDIKTTLLNKQGIMTKKIYDDLNEDTLTEIKSCGVSCLIFKYPEGERKLLVDVGANTLTYGNYTMKLIDGSHFGELSFNNSNTDSLLNVSEFYIKIPILSDFLDEDFGIHIVKTYNTGSIIINNEISINDAIITANNIDLPLRKDELITGSTTYWAKIFHQDHNNIDLKSKDSYFENYNEFIKSNNNHKFSSLKSLEIFRIPKEDKVKFLDNDNKLIEIDLIEETIEQRKDEYKDEKEKKKLEQKLNEQYQNGYFELLLEYPKISTTNYNLWTQTSNFVESSELENIYAIDIVYQGSSCKWNGLKFLTDTSSNQYVNGCQGGDNFAIGTRKNNTAIKGPGGEYEEEVNEVDLWIKADEYIKKYSLSVITD